MPEPCIGSCNSRWRRLTEAGEDIPEELLPYPGDPVFCQRDSSIIRREVAELDDLASIAAAAADGHRSQPGTQRVSGTARISSPSPAADDLDDLACMLRGWESAARGTDPSARRGYLATEITTVVCWLVAHHDAIIGNPDLAPDYAAEVRQWHRRLATSSKAGTGTHQKGRPCPRCDRYSLWWREGDEYVECQTPSCGRLMSLSDYELWDEAFDHVETPAAS